MRRKRKRLRTTLLESCEASEMVEDLKVKIGSPEEVFWTDLKAKVEADNLQCRRQLEINDNLLAFAKRKIAVEKEKIK